MSKTPEAVLIRRDGFDRPGERLRRRARPELGHHVRERVRDLLRVEGQADDRDQRDQRRKECEQAVVGERGRPVGRLSFWNP